MTQLFFGKEGIVDGPKVCVFDLNDGAQAMIQIFDDQQVHLMFRANRHDSWSIGFWSILAGTTL